MNNEHTTIKPRDANARENKMISTVIFFLEMAYALAMSKPKSFWLF
jgi:hypothetical protein